MNKRVITLLLVVLFVWNIILSVQLYQDNLKPHSDTKYIENVVEGFSSDLTTVFDAVEASIVTVESGLELSSGFVYAVKDDTTYIVTANHGISDPNNIVVTFDNNISYPATLVGSDSKSDIAVLALNLNFVVSPLKLGNAEILKAGEFLIAFGTPATKDFQNTASLTFMNDRELNLERSVLSDGVLVHYYQTYVQVTSNINPGMSGGPLVNMNGDVVAVNLMTFEQGQGILLATPINEVRIIADNIINQNPVTKIEFGFAGISIADMKNYEKVALGINIDTISGYYIDRLIGDSFASSIGLKKGDIITSINEEVIGSYEDLLAVQYSGESSYNFTILRNKEELKFLGSLND